MNCILNVSLCCCINVIVLSLLLQRLNSTMYKNYILCIIVVMFSYNYFSLSSSFFFSVFSRTKLCFIYNFVQNLIDFQPLCFQSFPSTCSHMKSSLDIVLCFLVFMPPSQFKGSTLSHQAWKLISLSCKAESFFLIKVKFT